MTKRCVIQNCNSNVRVKVAKSDGINVVRAYVPVFSFPSDPKLLSDWLAAIPNSDKITIRPNNGVCINHFRPIDIQGNLRKSLSSTAVPCFFNKNDSCKSESHP